MEDVAVALGDHDGPVLLVAPDVPGLGSHHIAGAREDLAHGVLLAIAPATDGRVFLLALARPEPELLQRAAATFDELLAATGTLGGGVGLLRHERRLATLADARAFAADPTAPADLRAFALLAAR